MAALDLFSSVRDGNTDIVRRLLQSKQCRARLNDRNEWGDTALHLAAEAGNGEICHMLIAAGASVTVRNNRGETCLHRAAVGGHVESVSAIVGRDQDPEAVNSQNDAGYTALHHAAKHGSRALIEILVKAGADRMLENNAGETPYMVAHKYAQWEAERLLLNVEQQHADRAIREMNRKEKDIVRAFFRAVKYASQIESRVRIMLIGDEESGKSSLKKTLLGEPYNPAEKPSSGIHADPSITRIKFKQYREWIQQPASKADTHRLNLEYIDTIIDYVLNFLKQGRVVSDDAVDPMMLQIEKEQVKNVKFIKKPNIIPPDEISEEGEEEGEESDEQTGEPNAEGGATGVPGDSSEAGDGGEAGDVERDGVSRVPSRDSGVGMPSTDLSSLRTCTSHSMPDSINRACTQSHSPAALSSVSLSLGDKHSPPQSPDTKRKLKKRSSSSSSLPSTATSVARSKGPYISPSPAHSSSSVSSPSHHSLSSADSTSGSSRSSIDGTAHFSEGDAADNMDDRLHRLATECLDASGSDSDSDHPSGGSALARAHPSPTHSLSSSSSGRRSPRPHTSSPNQGHLLHGRQTPDTSLQAQQPQPQQTEQQDQDLGPADDHAFENL